MLTNEQLVTQYISLREKVDAIKNEQIKPLEETMDKIEQLMSARLDAEGGQQFKASSGAMAYFQTNDSVACSDPEGFFAFVRANSAWDLIEKRASKTGVRAFIDSEKQIPPGVKYTQIRKVVFRRG